MISVIVPVFNEFSRLSLLNEVLLGLFVNLEEVGEDYEVVIVNDGSTDGTDEILRRAFILT